VPHFSRPLREVGTPQRRPQSWKSGASAPRWIFNRGPASAPVVALVN
jgi:hypothetical protein